MSRIFLVVVFVTGFILSLSFGHLVYRTYDFNAVDYPFYARFYEHAFEPHIEHVINPEGRNLFFFSGTDGARGLHQDIHFEPIKYAVALLYVFFDSTLLLYLVPFFIFLPLLYGALISRSNPKFDVSSSLLLVLYACIPGLLFMASDAPRPSTFLIPVFMMLILSILYERPKLEQISLFFLLFLIREEAIVLGLLVIAIMYGLRRPYIKQFLGIWSVGVIAFVSYMVWTGYGITITFEKIAQYIPIPLLAFGGLLSTGILIYMWRSRFVVTHIREYLALYASALISIFAVSVTAAHLIVDRELLSFAIGDLLPAVYTSVAMLGVVTFLLVLHYKFGMSRFITSVSSVFVVLFIGAQLFMPGMLFELSSKLQERIVSSAFLENVKESVKTHVVLADYGTINALHDSKQAYVLERLPAYVLEGSERFYPANTQTLITLLDHSIETIVVRNENVSIVSQLAEQAHKEIKLVSSNDVYSWYLVVR